MQWFYLHFPHLYGETWCQPFHSPQPLALINEKGGYIVDVNPAAEKSGVTSQMLVNTAFCLAPAIQIDIIRPDKAQQALLRVARLAYRFSAWIGLEPPDGLYLEVATMRKLFGGLAAIREQLLALFQELHYTLKVAAAPTPKAAHLLAHSGAELCLDQANLMATLQRIDVNCLNVSARTAERLQKLGLQTVHDVLQLPSGDLAYRIDGELADYLNKVTGRQPWQPRPVQMPEHFSLQANLEQEIENLHSLLFPLSAAVKKYCQFMQNRCLVSQSLKISLRHRQHTDTPLPIQLATADNRTDTWLYMLSQCAERVKLAAPVTGFMLKAATFEAIPPSSLQLFSHLPGMQGMSNEQHPDSEEARAYLLNRLTGRIGANHIHFTNLTEDPRPEHQTAYSFQPFPDKNSVAKKTLPATTTTWQQPAISQPLWLLTPPRPATIQHYRILRGPLRLDTGWWDNQPAQRDYYIGLEQRQDSPALHWLFRTTDKEWFIHGIFS
jgi:protein ImuB